MRLHSLVQPGAEKNADENRRRGSATAASAEQLYFAAAAHMQPCRASCSETSDQVTYSRLPL
jgi:hypothetical protein